MLIMYGAKIMASAPSVAVASLAMASLLMTRKTTPRALKRCRKRMQRASDRLEITEARNGAALPKDAIAALAKACAACGRCEGI